MVCEDDIQKAAAGDLATLVRLDGVGLLLGDGESAADYADRLRCLKRNVDEMDEALRQSGTYELEEITVQRDRRIPAALFAEAEDVTQSLYRFAIDWVPGFFINPRMSLLFGGCAFFFYPDFFVMFIIRRAFEHRPRWLIYGRRELLSHELCHVARIGLASQRFEENFAYQTSASAFRRVAGSIFHSPLDSLGFLGSALLLLIAQVARTMLLPALPIWPFWGVILLAFVLLCGRHARLLHVYASALRHAAWLAPECPAALLFRSTDEEISALCRLSSPGAAAAWLGARCGAELRWQVVRERFCTPTVGSPA